MHISTARHWQPPRQAYTLTYRLRNGAAGRITTQADSSCAAVLQAIDLFGDRLRSCSARPGLAGGAA